VVSLVLLLLKKDRETITQAEARLVVRMECGICSRNNHEGTRSIPSMKTHYNCSTYCNFFFHYSVVNERSISEAPVYALNTRLSVARTSIGPLPVELKNTLWTTAQMNPRGGLRLRFWVPQNYHYGASRSTALEASTYIAV